MNIENEVKRLKRDNRWMQIIMTLTVLTLLVVTVGGKKSDAKLAVKTAEIADKAGVECVTKTNSLFGILTKVEIVK